MKPLGTNPARALCELFRVLNARRVFAKGRGGAALRDKIVGLLLGILRAHDERSRKAGGVGGGDISTTRVPQTVPEGAQISGTKSHGVRTAVLTLCWLIKCQVNAAFIWTLWQ